MALVDARGFQLSPNVVGSFGQGVDVRGEQQRQQLLGQQAEVQQQQAQAALDKQARLQGILGRLGGGQPQQAAQAPQQALGGQSSQQPQALPQLGQPGAQQPAQLGAQAPAAQPAQLGAPQAPQIPFGNPQAMAELAIQFPEEFESINKNLGLITQKQKDDAADFSFRLRGTPFDQRGALIDQREAAVIARGGDPTNTISLRDMPEDAQNQALELTQMASLTPKQRQEVAEGTRAFGLDEKKFGLDQANVFSQIAERGVPKAFTLAPGEQRIQGGVVIAEGLPIQQTIPPQLLAGLPADVAAKSAAAFAAAGGGKDGIAAYGKIVDQAGETERRKASPKLIQQRFPGASPAETVQLQTAMDSAKTTQEGLKQAGDVRNQQRQMKKAKIFQVQAVELLDSIITNPQLGDVTGSLEGSFDTRLFSDAESGLIADIKEAADILTSDNMDLMSGVLSESDLALLKNMSSGALNRKRPEAGFIKRATVLRDRLKSAIIQTPDERGNEALAEAPDQTGTDAISPASSVSPSGRAGGVLKVDASGNRAFVFPDGTFEEVQ